MPPRIKLVLNDTLSVAAPQPRAIEAAEVDIEIFGLRGPVAGNGELKAGAKRPAGIGRAAAGETGRRRVEVPNAPPPVM